MFTTCSLWVTHPSEDPGADVDTALSALTEVEIGYAVLSSDFGQLESDLELKTLICSLFCCFLYSLAHHANAVIQNTTPHFSFFNPNFY